MLKRTMALLLSLAVCLSAAGCGKVESGDAESKSAETSAAEGKTDEETTQEEVTAEEDTTPEDEEVTDAPAAETKSGVREENCILQLFDDAEYGPSQAEALALAELAMKQYDCLEKNDPEGYAENINFASLTDKWAERIDDYKEDMMFEDNDDTEDGVLYLSLLYLLTLSDEITEFSEWSGGQEAYREKLEELIGRVDVNESSFFDATRERAEAPLGELDENTIVGLEVDHSKRDGDDIYLTCDLSVMAGDYMYICNEIVAWRVDGEWGMLCSNIRTMDNPYAGMTADEIKAAEKAREEADEENYSSEQTDNYESRGDTASRTAYEAFVGYMSEHQSEAGDDPAAFAEKACPQAFGGDGLNLKNGEPEAEGDKAIYDAMTAADITDGLIIVGDDSANRTPDDPYMSLYIDEVGSVYAYPLS